MAVEFAPDDYHKFELDWYEAKLYCFSLNIDGKVGWRLPTKEELDAIYESDNDFSQKTSTGYAPFYVTSSACSEGTYLRSFRDGSGDYFKYPWLHAFIVRPVRDLKAD